MQIKRLVIILSTVVLLLLIPIFAMQFTDEVNWNLDDFIVAAVLLFATIWGVDLIIRKVKRKKHRIALSIFVVGIFLLVWMELAFGIFGTAFAGS